jgi:hypothetical protein
MTTPAAIIVSAVFLALVVFLACWWFARRAESSAQQAKTAARKAQVDRDEVRGLYQKVTGMVAAFRDGRPSEVDFRPTCPMDGEPLRGFDAQSGKPVRYVHIDGLEHDDFSRQITRDAGRPMPAYTDPRPEAAPLPLGTPEQVPARTSPAPTGGTVSTYFQRVSDAAGAGLFDPDSLRSDLADITRKSWLPEPPPPDVPIPGAEPGQSTTPRRKPDPTRVGRSSRTRRVAGANRTPPTMPPSAPNGDGS